MIAGVILGGLGGRGAVILCLFRRYAAACGCDGVLPCSFDNGCMFEIRHGFEHAWIFKAGPAPLQNNDVKGVFWQFRDAGGKCTFTVVPESKTKIKHSPMEWLKPPNKNRYFTPVSGGPPVQAHPVPTVPVDSQVAPTQVDCETQETQKSQGLNPREHSTERHRSPRRQPRQEAASAIAMALPG